MALYSQALHTHINKVQSGWRKLLLSNPRTFARFEEGIGQRKGHETRDGENEEGEKLTLGSHQYLHSLGEEQPVPYHHSYIRYPCQQEPTVVGWLFAGFNVEGSLKERTWYYRSCENAALIRTDLFAERCSRQAMISIWPLCP